MCWAASASIRALQDRVQQLSHQLTVIGAAERLGQLEQGRLVQGHRVKSFREFFCRYSQSLTRWFLHARDRHTVTELRNPIYTTSRDSPTPHFLPGRAARKGDLGLLTDEHCSDCCGVLQLPIRSRFGRGLVKIWSVCHTMSQFRGLSVLS